MQRLVGIALVFGLTACTVEKRAQVEADLSKRLSPGCYTVDLFDPYRIEYPAANVPREVRKFLGVWKNGAWNGRICHDLYVTNAYADGTVDVIDAYGPDRGTGAEATVFKRKGTVKDGVLSFHSVGSAPVEYQLVGEYLVGKRIDAFGKYEITMSREVGLAEVPIPPKKPVRRS